MTTIQKFFMTILPKSWGEDMRAESHSWVIRCTHCGAGQSIWDVGGIRWKARSFGKRTLIRCSHCNGIHEAVIEPDDASEP